MSEYNIYTKTTNTTNQGCICHLNNSKLTYFRDVRETTPLNLYFDFHLKTLANLTIISLPIIPNKCILFFSR